MVEVSGERGKKEMESVEVIQSKESQAVLRVYKD